MYWELTESSRQVSVQRFVGSACKKAMCLNAKASSVGPNLLLKVIVLQDDSVFQHYHLLLAELLSSCH